MTCSSRKCANFRQASTAPWPRRATIARRDLPSRSAYHIQYVTRDEEGASIGTEPELFGLNGELRERHQTTRDVYERRFRGLVTDGIDTGVFAADRRARDRRGHPRHRPQAWGAGIGRADRLTADQIADEYIRFVLKALEHERVRSQ